MVLATLPALVTAMVQACRPSVQTLVKPDQTVGTQLQVAD